MSWVSQYWSEHVNSPFLCVNTFETESEAIAHQEKISSPDTVYFDERYAPGICQGQNGVFCKIEDLPVDEE
jgi:hypothetical protein